MPDIIRATGLDTKETYVDMGDGTHDLRIAIGNGLAGVVVTTNTSPVSGAFTVIQVLEDANFSAFSEAGADLTPPTLAECQAFCAGAVLTTGEPDHSSV